MFIPAGELPLPFEYRCFELDRVIEAPPADIAQRTVVLLDCGNIDRNSAGVLRDGAHLLNIDHHHDNTRFGTLDHVVADASCTAEIIWDLMHGLGVAPTPAVAEALYVGLVTDTGRFMYENTGPRAHRMAAELIEAGVDVQAVYRRLYEETPYAKLALLALALGQVRRFDSGELTLAVLSAEDFRRAEAEDSYSEGIVDHLRAVQGTKVAALVRELTAAERRGERKVSLRAVDDDVDVSAIARAQGGGGHRRAAGFSTTLEPEDDLRACRVRAAPGDGAGAADTAAPATGDGRGPVDRQACGDHLARRGRRGAPRAGRRQDRPRGDARPVRERPAAGAGGARDAHPGAADGPAQALRDDRAARRGVEHRRPGGGDRADRHAATRPSVLPTGEIRQRPPIYSAVKIGGERAYKRARRGERFEMPERLVTVYRFEQLWRDGSPPTHARGT